MEDINVRHRQDILRQTSQRYLNYAVRRTDIKQI